MKRETGILLFLVFTNLCWATAIVLYDRDVKKIKADLRESSRVEIEFVEDGKRMWLRMKNRERFDAISCDGDSISVKIGFGEVDTIFTKVTVADLIAAKQR